MALKKTVRKLIKSFFGIDGISLFVKKQKKKVMKKLYTRKYSADDLVAEMCKMGMQNGSVVFVHNSMTDFYNYSGTGIELVEKIIDVIGKEGTLMMPAYPKNKFETLNRNSKTEQVDFDVKDTPSGAGYLSEVFRNYPGVKRSINLQHSVCAYGRQAEFFTSEHHLSITAWDEFSPYYKMCQVKTLVFALGLPYFLGTMMHCSESLLRKKYKYFTLFFKKQVSYSYRDEKKNVKIHNMLSHDISRKHNRELVIKKYFDKKQFHLRYISNLRIEMVEAKYTLDLLLDLADRGITMYSKPSPEKYIKNGRFIKIDG